MDLFWVIFLSLALTLIGWASRGRRRPRIPLVLAPSSADNGVACLAMALKYHGKGQDLGLEALRPLMNPDPEYGTNAQVIVDVARSYGLRTRGVSIHADQLEYLEPATIVHCTEGAGPCPRRFFGGNGRFFVFDRLRDGHVDLLSAESGRITLSLEVFLRHFTGVAVVFET